MKTTRALRLLAEVTAYQGGMVTSAQAGMRGITRLDLSRLTADGHLERVAHGVYKDAGTPAGPHDDLRAAWLSTDPKAMSEARIKSPAHGVVVAGESAADLHGIGDFRALRHEFTSPARRQSQRSSIRYRQRTLAPRDVVLVDGLPAMTMERTIADLVDDVKDLSLVADALRDASDRRPLDLPRLRELLAPLAARDGFKKNDGDALLVRLMQIAGIAPIGDPDKWFSEVERSSAAWLRHRGLDVLSVQRREGNLLKTPDAVAVTQPVTIELKSATGTLNSIVQRIRSGRWQSRRVMVDIRGTGAPLEQQRPLCALPSSDINVIWTK